MALLISLTWQCWDCGLLGVARLDISSAVHDALAVHPDRDHRASILIHG